jgi:hypothetical protein
MTHSAFRTILAPFLSVLAFGAAGCAGTPDSAPADAPPADRLDLGEYVAHISPKRGTFTLERLHRKAAGKPGVGPQSLDEITIAQDGTAGMGTADTVELVTTGTPGVNSGCPTGFQTSAYFCGDVTMRSFYAGRSLNNVYLQVTKVEAAGINTTTHSGANSDASYAPSGSTLLANTLGLWQFTGSGVTSPGVLAQAVVASNGGNAGTRTLAFDNPDDVDTTIYMHVFATLTYSDYVMTGSALTGFVDACTTTGFTKALFSSSTTATNTADLPFPFTFYGSLFAAASKVTLVRYGAFGFGTPTGTFWNTPTNINLPDTGIPAGSFQPGVFPFWDDLNYTTNLTASGVCTVTTGTAPNRKFVLTWKKMKFSGDTNGTADLTFSAALSEGSDRIDFAYSSMTASNQARANGNSSTIGVQNTGATLAVKKFNVPNSAGTATTGSYALTPLP